MIKRKDKKELCPPEFFQTQLNNCAALTAILIFGKISAGQINKIDERRIRIRQKKQSKCSGRDEAGKDLLQAADLYSGLMIPATILKQKPLKKPVKLFYKLKIVVLFCRRKQNHRVFIINLKEKP